MVDENEFFRDVTLRILGTLKVEDGLKTCREYLSDYMPVDSIYLEKHAYEFNGMRMVARANAETCEKMNVIIPFSQEATESMARMAEKWKDGSFPSVCIFNRPDEEPVCTCLLSALGGGL